MPENLPFLNIFRRNVPHVEMFRKQIEKYRNGTIVEMPNYQGSITVPIVEGYGKTFHEHGEFSFPARVIVGQDVSLPQFTSSQYPTAFSLLFFEGLTKLTNGQIAYSLDGQDQGVFVMKKIKERSSANPTIPITVLYAHGAMSMGKPLIATNGGKQMFLEEIIDAIKQRDYVSQGDNSSETILLAACNSGGIDITVGATLIYPAGKTNGLFGSEEIRISESGN